ncbi:carbohydrate-binding domain-containing protein [Mycolicibacterium brisbanense]|uniref:Ricin-type beta-trefoil lectin domain-containing /glycosylhydrolase family 16-like protein n=1 Tax=Mycolicibacterium brisbanense TaxID=146020 RepID=A0A117I4G9_9MYCO|nr:carbohydrate-binding domain-containing protein [Mycolicibacterium brisbanense]GAS86912.1 ricin-type beta-trefoil lectin domain-containing /glycosylhydrolase family 16-like protein [Mycolicibacterium brisbanense]
MIRLCCALVSIVALASFGIGPLRAPAAMAADVAGVEAESMTVTPSSAGWIVRDRSASGGAALVLRGASTARWAASLPASIKVTVRAEGQQCRGAPVMTVTVDGANVGSGTVGTTSWSDYSASATIPAGSHTIGVSFTNPYARGNCTRLLLVDTVTVVPDAAPPTTPPGSGDVTPAPVADLPGWKHIFADDFTLDAPVGSWANPSDPSKIVYVGAQGQQWLTYPQTYTDTYQHRPYRADQVLSVSNGMLVFDLHNVDGQPAGANPAPLLPNGSLYQTYGRYSARLRVDTPDLSEYHIAWLLWPQSEKWPTDGEEDFPEGSLAGTPSAFHHYALSSGGQETADAGVPFTGWHVYTIEWSPGRVRFLLDDTLVLQSTRYVANKPMRWQLQTETQGNGTHRGRLLVDWVSIWSYAGT